VDAQTRRRKICSASACALDAELADCQQIGLQLQLGEAPGVGPQATRAQFHEALEIALLLLQMLRAKEKPFAPDDLVVIRHAPRPPL
jgi:hypothetical protein